MPPAHVLQLEPELAVASFDWLDCTAKALNSFVTLSLLQDGQLTVASLDLRRTSKSELHSVHVYSNIGIARLFAMAIIRLLSGIKYTELDGKREYEKQLFSFPGVH